MPIAEYPKKERLHCRTHLTATSNLLFEYRASFFHSSASLLRPVRQITVYKLQNITIDSAECSEPIPWYNKKWTAPNTQSIKIQYGAIRY
jgi:hypothetical protein